MVPFHVNNRLLISLKVPPYNMDFCHIFINSFFNYFYLRVLYEVCWKVFRRSEKGLTYEKLG